MRPLPLGLMARKGFFLTLFGGILLTGVLAWIAWNASVAQRRGMFESEAGFIKQTVFERIQVSDAVAKSMQALFHSSLSIDADQFRVFSQELVTRYPFIQAVTYYPHLKQKDRRAFEDEQELWGAVDFQVFEFHDKRKFPAAVRLFYFPALYREPLKAADAMLLGYDVLSDETLAPSINLAIKSGMAVPSPLRTLADREGYDVFIALYEGKHVPKTLEERQKTVNGLLSLTIVPASLFEMAHLSENMTIRLENVSLTTPESSVTAVIFEQAPTLKKTLFHLTFAASYPVNVSAQQFTLSLSRSVLVRELQLWTLSLAALFGILLTIGTCVIQQSRANLRQELHIRRLAEQELDKSVQQRTQELNALHALLARISAVEKDLGDAAKNMTEVSSEMAAGAVQMSHLITVVSANSQQINQRVHDVSVATEEIAANIREIARHVEEVARLILEIVSTSSSAKTALGELNAHSQEVSELLSVITEIAQQTNMLSLNASIEASRAGDIGHGFNVVAREIKELARQTTQLAKDITKKVSVMQASSSNTTDATHEVIEHVNRVAELSQMIRDAISQQSQVTTESSISLNEVSDGTREIAAAIQEVTIVAQNSSNLASQVDQDAKQLALFAQQLRDLIAQFDQKIEFEQEQPSS